MEETKKKRKRFKMKGVLVAKPGVKVVHRETPKKEEKDDISV